MNLGTLQRLNRETQERRGLDSAALRARTVALQRRILGSIVLMHALTALLLAGLALVRQPGYDFARWQWPPLGSGLAQRDAIPITLSLVAVIAALSIALVQIRPDRDIAPEPAVSVWAEQIALVAVLVGILAVTAAWASVLYGAPLAGVTQLLVSGAAIAGCLIAAAVQSWAGMNALRRARLKIELVDYKRRMATFEAGGGPSATAEIGRMAAFCAAYALTSTIAVGLSLWTTEASRREGVGICGVLIVLALVSAASRLAAAETFTTAVVAGSRIGRLAALPLVIGSIGLEVVVAIAMVSLSLGFPVAGAVYFVGSAVVATLIWVGYRTNRGPGAFARRRSVRAAQLGQRRLAQALHDLPRP